MHEQKLLKLIRSLTKAEKRNFKLFIRRNNPQSMDLKQIILFDILERFDQFHAAAIRKELPELSKKNMNELSAALYRNILKSLRILHSREAEYRVREMIDHAQLLYQRGLFSDSLELLAQAKQQARLLQKPFLVYEIIDFEKKIESRHVTSSHQERANELTYEAIETRDTIQVEGYWTELSLQLYDFYLKCGHSRNEEERKIVDDLFLKDRPAGAERDSSFFYERLYKYQSHVWYYYILQEFSLAYRYTVAWITLFDNNPLFLRNERFHLLKGYHNCLSVLYFCQDPGRFRTYRQQMEQFITENNDHFDRNTQFIAFIYKHMAQLNEIVLNGTFSESIPYLRSLETQIIERRNELDHHRLMVFHYKMATIYFTVGDYKKCLYFLNLIINDNPKSLHEDVQSFARILNLITHYELGNFELIFFQVKSVYRFLLKLDETQEIQREIISFLRKMVRISVDEVPSLFQDFYENLLKISENKYENRAFLYLDFISWLESKLQNRPVEEIIREKRELGIR